MGMSTENPGISGEKKESLRKKYEREKVKFKTEKPSLNSGRKKREKEKPLVQKEVKMTRG
jgi:hypothetical protein